MVSDVLINAFWFLSILHCTSYLLTMKNCTTVPEVRSVNLGCPVQKYAYMQHDDSNWSHFRSPIVHWEACVVCTPLILDIAFFYFSSLDVGFMLTS